MESNRTFPNSEICDRFGYHRGTKVTQPVHETLRMLFFDMARDIDVLLPAGRAKSLAFTELENAAMWSHKAVAEMDPLVEIEVHPEVIARLNAAREEG